MSEEMLEYARELRAANADLKTETVTLRARIAELEADCAKKDEALKKADELSRRGMCLNGKEQRELFVSIANAANHALATTAGASLLAELARLRAEKEEAVEKEQARWQDELDKLFAHLVPDAQIDGGGCDSGDPMDFSMSEISQALVYVIDQRDAAIAQRDQALAVAKGLGEVLKELRTNIKLWKSSGAGGQDTYAGLPPGMRIVDAALAKLSALARTEGQGEGGAE